MTDNQTNPEVLHLTGFDNIFSPYEQRTTTHQPLESRFRRLMGRSLKLFYKTSLKRNASGETTLYIQSIEIMGW